MMSSNPIVVDSAASLPASRSVPIRDQASSRSAFGAIIEIPPVELPFIVQFNELAVGRIIDDRIGRVPRRHLTIGDRSRKDRIFVKGDLAALVRFRREAAYEYGHNQDRREEAVLLPGFRGLEAEMAIDLPLEALSHFTLPACLIHGDQDEFFPAHIPARMATILPDAELHLIPGQSHAMIFRRPWQVGKIMQEFLGREET